MAEGIVKNEGAAEMSNKRFQRMFEEYTPPNLMDRFDMK
jgi:hypothetical protein